MISLSSLKKNNLIELCKEYNIKYSSKTKDELIKLIKEKKDENKEEKDEENKEKDEESSKEKRIKPLLKWVGGKTQIIDKVISKFPLNIKNYHELFLGGGSVLFTFLKYVREGKIKISGKIYAYDLNETLINLYKNIQTVPNEVLEEIKKMIDVYSKINGSKVNRNPDTTEEAKTSKESYYYYIRNVFNRLKPNEKNKPIGTAHFIFLNKTCFRGVYREGPNGFNVPFGNYKNPEIINEQHLYEISNLIKDVIFIHSDFEESFLNIDKEDFIYMDPPYAPENKNSFVSYTSSGFSIDKHNKLFELCKDYKFLMSNSDVSMIKEHFKDDLYTIDVISCKRAINSKNPESKVNEVLIYPKI